MTRSDLLALPLTLVVDAPAPPVSAKTAAFLAEVAAELPPPPPVSRRRPAVLDAVRAFVAADPRAAVAVLAAVQGGLDAAVGIALEDDAPDSPDVRWAVALRDQLEDVQRATEDADARERDRRVRATDAGIAAADRAFRRSARVED